MNSLWQFWRGALPKEWCARVIEECSKLPPVQGVIGHGGKSVVDTNFRRSVIRWVPWEWEMRQTLEHYFHMANANAFGFDLSCLLEIQFTEYSSENCGEYKMHSDNTWKNSAPMDRKLSMVIQLSNPDDYEGCDLVLADESPSKHELRTQGSVIVFPSFIKHGVTPCTKGKRFSLVSWFKGPKFR